MPTTIDCIPAFFGQVDAHLPAIPTHPAAHLWPREVGPLGLLHALTGGGHRACARWLTRDSRALGPRLPERPRLLRLLQPHQDGPRAFLATPTGLGVIDTDGIDRLPPPDGRAAARRRWAAQASRITAGWSAAPGGWCCTSGGGLWGGRVPPPMSQISPFRGGCGRATDA